jgi:hypothetical protein
MTGGPVIGVLGATGAVGGAVARVAAAAREVGVVRLGARRSGALRPLLAGLDGRAEAVEVEVGDPASLARFCAGCRVLVNCVGPLVPGRADVATATWAAGGDYLDPGGDERLHRELVARLAAAPVSRAAVLGAGVMPGLSGLVPRWLAAQDLAPPLRLTGYVATLDRMTPATAAEFLLSLVDAGGEPNASWRAGARVPRDLEPLHRVELPFFPGPVTAHPYLSAETERLARSLRLAEARWYHVFDPDGHVLPALSGLQPELRQGAGLTGAARRLSEAVALEMFGRRPFQQLVIQLSGERAGRPAYRVAVLRAAGTYQLTATVTAAVVADLAGGRVPGGVHFAADVLDPGLVARLPGQPGVVGLHLLDHPLPAYAETDLGEV